jgi:hypothetical protein
MKDRQHCAPTIHNVASYIWIAAAENSESEETVRVFDDAALGWPACSTHHDALITGSLQVSKQGGSGT